MHRIALLGLVVALTACGGKIDGADGGTGGADGGATQDASAKDATPTVDAIAPPPMLCTPIDSNSAEGPDGSCQISESWSCGATKYSVQCNCPNATCTCSQESGSTGVGMLVNAPSVCPSCSGTGLAALCNFPTN